MKKLVVFMLAALFLLGSFPMAFAEGDIMPLWDCDHSCGSDPTGWEESDRGCYSTWVKKYFCRECGRQTSQDVTIEWHHLGPFFGRSNMMRPMDKLLRLASVMNAEDLHSRSV